MNATQTLQVGITPELIDQVLEEFKSSMRWSPSATDHEKTLVLGNLNGFAAKLRSRVIDEASYADLRASGGIVGAP